jgi:hypothetical protein
MMIIKLLRKNALSKLKDYLLELDDREATEENDKELWSKAVGP